MLESHANIYILLSGVGLSESMSTAAHMHAKQIERNNSESNIHFMIAVTVKLLL